MSSTRLVCLRRQAPRARHRQPRRRRRVQSGLFGGRFCAQDPCKIPPPVTISPPRARRRSLFRGNSAVTAELATIAAISFSWTTGWRCSGGSFVYPVQATAGRESLSEGALPLARMSTPSAVRCRRRISAAFRHETQTLPGLPSQHRLASRTGRVSLDLGFGRGRISDYGRADRGRSGGGGRAFLRPLAAWRARSFV
jgi:hypothetical protein